MAEESEKSKGITSIVHTFLSFIPADLRELVGFFTGFVLMLAIPVSIVLGVLTLYHMMQKTKTNNVACWQVQTIEKRVFKLNTCTGELGEVAIESKEAASASTK